MNAGNYTVEAVYNGDVNTGVGSMSANFTVAKAEPDVKAEVKDIIYGDDETIIITSDASGNVTVKLNGQIIAEELSLENGYKAVLMVSRWAVTPYDGKATVNVANLKAGKYTVEVTYNGNENYNTKTVTYTFNVFKANSTVDVEIDQSMKYGEGQQINITVNNPNATGNVIVSIDGVQHNVSLNDGKANYTLAGLSAGNHTVTVVYEGDNNLNGNWTSNVIEVIKAISDLTIKEIKNITVGESVTIELELAPGSAAGDVAVFVNGVQYNLTSDNLSVTVPGLAADEYVVNAYYYGNENFTDSTASAKFTVSKKNAPINASANDIASGDNVTIKISDLPSDATGYVIINVNGTEFALNVTNAREISIPITKAGTYEVAVKYLGDDNYMSNSSSTSFNASSKSGEVTVEIGDAVAGGDLDVKVTVPSDASGTITVKVGNTTKVV